MSDDLADDEGGHEDEGVAAFIRMSAALDNLQSHMAAFDQGLNLGLQGLNLSVKEAEKAASKAATAALDARQAAEHAEATARAKGRSAASWAVLGAVAGLLVAGGAGYWLGHASGQESGLADGYRAAMDEKAAAAWANTPAGQLALGLDKAGSINQLARCNSQGWTVTVQDGHKVCFPHAAADGKVYGWTLF